jgi:hypothetical protein
MWGGHGANSIERINEEKFQGVLSNVDFSHTRDRLLSAEAKMFK